MSDMLELGFEALGGPVANNADKAKRKIQDAWHGQPSRSSSQHHHRDRSQNIQDWQHQVEQERAPGPRARADRHDSWDNWQFPPQQQQNGRQRPMIQRRASSLDRGTENYYGRRGDVYRPERDRDYELSHYQTPYDSESTDSRDASNRGRRRRAARHSEDRGAKSKGQAGRLDKDKDKDREDMSTKDKVKDKLKGHEALVAGVATVATIYAGAKFYSAYQNDKKRHDKIKKGSPTRK